MTAGRKLAWPRCTGYNTYSDRGRGGGGGGGGGGREKRSRTKRKKRWPLRNRGCRGTKGTRIDSDREREGGGREGGRERWSRSRPLLGAARRGTVYILAEG